MPLPHIGHIGVTYIPIRTSDKGIAKLNIPKFTKRSHIKKINNNIDEMIKLIAITHIRPYDIG